ncbi:MAG: PKD domain-containing protein [Bacteroidia bacterium]
MKKLYLFLAVLLSALSLEAQNCMYTATVANGNVVTFIPNISPPISAGPIFWNFGNGATITAPNGPITHTYVTAGVYNVCMSVYDSSNSSVICTYCDSLLINGCSVTASQNPNSPYQFTFNASLQWPFGSYAYWSFGDGTSGQGTSVTHTYGSVGTYTVTMYEQDSMGNVICSSTLAVTVSNTSGTSCSFAYTPGVPPSPSSVITFQGASNMTNPTYTWDFGDGTPLVTGANPQHGYGSAGSYNVCVYVWDGVDSCSYCQVIPVAGSSSTCNFFAVPDSMNASQYYFYGTPSGTSSVLTWDFGDNTSGTGTNVSHIYSQPGTYQVCMTEVSFLGVVLCQTCQSVTVSGSGVPSCLFSATAQSPGNPFVISFNAQYYPNTTYTWDFGNGQTITAGSSTTCIYNAPGIYNVCLTVMGGGVVDTCCYAITVGTSNNCGFTFIPDSINPSTVYFFGTASSAGTTLVWHFGDSTTSVGPFITHTYAAPGTYYVCMTEVDSMGNTVCQFCQNVTITSGGNCNFSISSNPGNPFVVDFIAGSLVGTSFIWDFGDGTTGNGQSITHTYAQPGTYTVCLSIGVGGAIVCTGCQTIVIAANSWCQAAFTSVSLGLNAYFINQSTIIPINVPPLPPPVNYLWDFGDGSTSSLQFPNHQYATPGTYMVCLTGSTVGCTATYCDTVVIDTIINNPTTCNAYFVFTQTSPYNVVGVNLSSGINLNFSWNFGDGGTSNVPYPIHQYSSTGTYMVCLTVSDANGCSSTYCDTLTVDSLGNVVYKGATSSGFTLNIVPPNTLGVNEQVAAIGSIFPVPASADINVRLSDNVKEEVTYNVMSMEGRKVMNGMFNAKTGTIHIADLQQGIYLLEVITSDGQRDSKYFVKQ